MVRVLGIDPGTKVVGWGVLDTNGVRHALVAHGAIRTTVGDELALRLVEVHDGLTRTIAEHRPEVIALEDVFFGKNFQSAIRLGEGRGVALLCAAQAGVPVAEYPPATIKKAVVGWGRADKEQVARMVQAVLRMAELPTPRDAADALAIAICHCHRIGRVAARPRAQGRRAPAFTRAQCEELARRVRARG